LLLEHITRFRGFDRGEGALGSLFSGAIDFRRIGLFGHSRGGESVVSAALEEQDPEVRIAAVLSVAPVDFHEFVLRDTPYFVVLPAADGDVTDNDGAKIFDRAVFETQGFKSQSYLYGANHNFFNDQWTVDEGEGAERISKADQQAWLR